MDQERLDYADSPEEWPPEDLRPARPLWLGSRAFGVGAGGLVLAVMAGQFFISGAIKAWWGWGVLLSLVALPFLLIGFAAHRVSRAARGQRVVRVCGWVVVGLGIVLVLSPFYDLQHWMNHGRMPAEPALLAFGFHLVAGQWAAAAVAVGWWAGRSAMFSAPSMDAEKQDRSPSRRDTRVVFPVLAWLSPVIPLLTIVVMCGMWTYHAQPGNRDALKHEHYSVIGHTLLITQMVSVGLAAISMAGIRCRRGAATIIPAAVSGLVLNLTCLPFTFVWTWFFGSKWSPA